MPTVSTNPHSIALNFNEGEHLTVEHGSLVAHSDQIKFEHCPESNILAGIRRAVAGSSFQARRLTWLSDDAWVVLGGPGDTPSSVISLDVPRGEDGSLVIADGAWLANTSGVNLAPAWKGVKSALARERAVMSRATGEGTVVLYHPGSITQIDLEEGQNIHLGQGRLVAYSGDVTLDANRIANRTVITASGPGTVLYSSNSETA